MFSSIARTSGRQREIAEVVFRNGWDYMRGLLTGGKADEPRLPTPAVLRNILIDLGPVYVKLGQLLSTRPDLLPGSYIDALSTLQADVPPVAWPEVEAILRQQYIRPLDEIFSKIETNPVAAGSIAQTHRATLASGEEVALKIQRPGIDSIIAQDIAIIKGLAELVELTEFGQDYDASTLAEEFTSALLKELDFTQEASYADQLRRNLSNSRWFDTKHIVVPKIYWALTTEKLMVMEWLDGVPILMAEVLENRNGQTVVLSRREITRLIFRAFFQQIYLDGFFHADPHPGNIFYLNDGRVALIDCGMVGRLDPRTQSILVEMLLSIIDLDAQRCAQLTLKLAESSGRPVNLSRLEADYTRLLRRYYNRSLAEINFSEVFYEILQVARDNKIRLPGNMGLYAKTLANLEGVARSFDPEVNLLDEIRPLMTDLFRRQLLGDNPVQTLLRTAIDVKNLSLESPRQVEALLDRVSTETLTWNLQVKNLDALRRSLDDSANRLSFSIVVGALIIGAATISTGGASQFLWLSYLLFAAASLLGLWLIISILRSGRLR
ncbi:MAG: ABC1 kinase family protein [Thainema sp.]